MSSSDQSAGASVADQPDQKNASSTIEWPVIHPLRKTVTVLGEEISSLTLREPTAAEFLKLGIFDSDVTGEQMLDLIATLSGLAPAAVRALPGLDMLALSAKLSQVFRQAAS